MYQPAHFRVEDKETLYEFIRAHPLGLLISAGADGAIADPVPFLVDAKAGLLRAHMARANPHWRELAGSGRALVVFQASGHYISPGWYPSKQETGRVVPTWNYVIVEVRGRVTIHEDPEWLMRQVSDLTGLHEAGRGNAWKVSDAPEAFVAAQLRAIVGFEIEIESMNGKYKLSQNRQEQDRAGVVAGLEAEGTAGAAIAALMRKQGIGV